MNLWVPEDDEFRYLRTDTRYRKKGRFLMKRTMIALLLVGALLTPLAAAPGDYTDLGSGWGETKTMASMGGYLWIIYGDTLYRVDEQGAYRDMGSGWGEGYHMTATDNYLWIVYGDTLYRVDANGAYQSMGSGWGETLAMTSLNNTVYIVYADTLYRVEAE